MSTSRESEARSAKPGKEQSTYGFVSIGVFGFSLLFYFGFFGLPGRRAPTLGIVGAPVMLFLVAAALLGMLAAFVGMSRAEKARPCVVGLLSNAMILASYFFWSPPAMLH